MRPLKISIHKLSNGQFITCFIDPKTGKKRRNRFLSKREAITYTDQVNLRYRMKGEHSFSHHPVAKLMKFHMEKCPHTRVAKNKSCFRSFIETFGEYNISELERSELVQWLRNRQTKYNYSEKTLHVHKHLINHFFKFLHDEGIIKYNPMTTINFNLHAPSRRKRAVLSVEEIKELLQNAPKFDHVYFYPLIYLLVHTGARRGEAIKLKKEDVDFKLGQFTFRDTKNGDERTINLSPGLSEFLKRQMSTHDSPYVFRGPHTEQLERTYVMRMCRRYKAHFPNGKNWCYHSLRHSFAHNYLVQGGNMYELQAILGHRNIKMTIDLYGQIKAHEIRNFSPYENKTEES